MTSTDKTRALIARYLAAHSARDIEAMVACVSDDIIHDVNQGERRLGRDRFHAFCARMAHHYEEKVEDAVILVSEDGSRAAAEFNVKGIYRETEPGLPPANGQSYAMPGAMFFAIRDDAIARITMYYNLTEWIMQVSQDTP